jgi:hypothetical protein
MGERERRGREEMERGREEGRETLTLTQTRSGLDTQGCGVE